MVKMLVKFYLLFVYIFVSHNPSSKATLVPVSPCKGSNEGYCSIKKINVNPSEKVIEDDTCIVDTGSNVSVSFNYTPGFTSNTVKWSISQVTIFGDFRLKQLDDNACHFTKCPVEANTPNRFEVLLSIPANFRARKYSTKVKLLGNDTKENCCFLVDIRIRKPVDRTAVQTPQQTLAPMDDFYGFPITFPNGSLASPPTWKEFLNFSLTNRNKTIDVTTTTKVSFWKRPFYNLWSGNKENNEVEVDNVAATINETNVGNETTNANETDYGNEFEIQDETFDNIEINPDNETAPEYETVGDNEINPENETKTSNQLEVDIGNETSSDKDYVEENSNDIVNEQNNITETETPTEITEIETSKSQTEVSPTAMVSSTSPTTKVGSDTESEKIIMKARVVPDPKTGAKPKNVLTLKIWLPNLEINKIQ